MFVGISNSYHCQLSVSLRTVNKFANQTECISIPELEHLCIVLYYYDALKSLNSSILP